MSLPQVFARTALTMLSHTEMANKKKSKKPKKKTPPILRLPPELLAHIIESCDYQGDLYRAALVCRRIRPIATQHLYKNPVMGMDLDADGKTVRRISTEHPITGSKKRWSRFMESVTASPVLAAYVKSLWWLHACLHHLLGDDHDCTKANVAAVAPVVALPQAVLKNCRELSVALLPCGATAIHQPRPHASLANVLQFASAVTPFLRSLRADEISAIGSLSSRPPHLDTMLFKDMVDCGSTIGDLFRFGKGWLRELTLAESEYGDRMTEEAFTALAELGGSLRSLVWGWGSGIEPGESARPIPLLPELLPDLEDFTFYPWTNDIIYDPFRGRFSHVKKLRVQPEAAEDDVNAPNILADLQTALDRGGFPALSYLILSFYGSYVEKPQFKDSVEELKKWSEKANVCCEVVDVTAAWRQEED